MPTKRSLVHPKFKTKYRVANWSHYDQSLVERGNIRRVLQAMGLSFDVPELAPARARTNAL